MELPLRHLVYRTWTRLGRFNNSRSRLPLPRSSRYLRCCRGIGRRRWKRRETLSRPAAGPTRVRAARAYRPAAQKQKSHRVADLSEHGDISGLARGHVKAPSYLTQERLTVVEISGGDGGSYRHRGEWSL